MEALIDGGGMSFEEVGVIEERSLVGGGVG
jgi:hypothetical protein